MILLDTHSAYWMAGDQPALGPKSRKLIAKAQQAAELAISAISFWELAILVSKRRIVINDTVESMRRTMMSIGISELPVTGEIGILAVELKNLHNDPADRIIAATAAMHGATLITADKQLLKWRGKLARHDATK